MGRHESKKHKITKEDKQKEVGEIREFISQYKHIIVLRFSSDKSDELTEIRRVLRTSRLKLSKCKLLQIALGTSAENEAKPNTHLLSEHIKGKGIGLLFTDEDVKEILSYLTGIKKSIYATEGDIATERYVVPEGDYPQFTGSQDSYLRSLGLHAQLINGVIRNIHEYVVCEEGQPLKKNQALLLKLFNVKMGVYKVDPIVIYSEGQIVSP